MRAEWSVPEGVVIAPDVDLSRNDPAGQEGTARRRCISVRKAGGRCSVNAMNGRALCSAHSGHLDSSAGGRAKADKIQGQKAEAEERMVTSRLGARAIIRQAILEEADNLTKTVKDLVQAAASGDRKAAALVLPYLTQGFGTPNVPADAETPPDAGFDVSQLTVEELRQLANGPGLPD